MQFKSNDITQLEEHTNRMEHYIKWASTFNSATQDSLLHSLIFIMSQVHENENAKVLLLKKWFNKTIEDKLRYANSHKPGICANTIHFPVITCSHTSTTVMLKRPHLNVLLDKMIALATNRNSPTGGLLS